MVGADHHAVGHAGDAVLRLHALARFFIAANKVAELNPGFPQRLLAGQHRALNIDRQHAIRLDEGDGILAILLIRLHAVRQAHGDKLAAIVTLCPQLINCLLAQFTGQG